MSQRHWRFWLWLAHRMPRPLVYWCVIRAGAHASGSLYPNQHPSALGLLETLDRWEAQ